MRKEIARVLTVYNQQAKSKVNFNLELSGLFNCVFHLTLPDLPLFLFLLSCLSLSLSQLRETCAGAGFVPKALREKKTRAIRRRLTPEQVSKRPELS